MALEAASRGREKREEMMEKEEVERPLTSSTVLNSFC